MPSNINKTFTRTSFDGGEALPLRHYLVHLFDVVRSDGKRATGHIHNRTLVKVRGKQVLLHCGTHQDLQRKEREKDYTRIKTRKVHGKIWLAVSKPATTYITTRL